MDPILLAWSGGKDSMLTLHELQRESASRVAALLTTVVEDSQRVSSHGVPRALVEQQAHSLGYALEIVTLPAQASNEQYTQAWGPMLARYRGAGVKQIAFGDLALEDVRAFREAQVARFGMSARFPLWQRETDTLAREFLRLDYRAVVACVDTGRLPAELAGQPYDEAFLGRLPQGVDPAGENGEFHTFVHDGPLFRQPIRFEQGEAFLMDDRFAVRELLVSPPARKAGSPSA
jgi:uncharacterized protein (TIGR00290 family)